MRQSIDPGVRGVVLGGHTFPVDLRAKAMAGSPVAGSGWMYQLSLAHQQLSAIKTKSPNATRRSRNFNAQFAIVVCVRMTRAFSGTMLTAPFIKQNSPCAPSASTCGLIGALGVACGPTGISEISWGRLKALYR